MNHNLKILPEYFGAVYRGDKTFEVRKNDRNFKVDEGVFLREWDANRGMYTGRQIGVRITYILDNPEYCKEGFVIFGFELGAISLRYSEEYKETA